MTIRTRILGFIRRPASRIKSYWRHEWYWQIQRSLFERRHFRRLIPIVFLLSILTVVWCVLVLAIALSLGAHDVIFHPGFAQSIIASLIVLPISLAIGVVIGTLVQKHSLRFQARHAGDNLGDCVGLAVFKFILFLKRQCQIPIDLEGPVDHKFIQKARETTKQHLSSNNYKEDLHVDLEGKLSETVNSISLCFNKSADLRLAFPQSFDLFELLKSLVEDIEKGRSESSPENTALIVLHFAAQMIEELR